MATDNERPLIYIGTCPVCDGGTCRVRVCTTFGGVPEAFVMCDECEAIWMKPKLDDKYEYPLVANPCCPVCDMPLWGEGSRWATRKDVELLGWIDFVTIDETPPTSPPESDSGIASKNAVPGGSATKDSSSGSPSSTKGGDGLLGGTGSNPRFS